MSYSRWRQRSWPFRAPGLTRAPSVAPSGWADSEPIPEGTGQVGRIGKPGPFGNLADRQAAFEEAPSALKSQQNAVAMRRYPEKLLKAAHQMALRHLRFNG